MRASDNSGGRQPKSIPRWLAFVLFGVIWIALPWGLSLLTPRYGWTAGRPGSWNWLGLVPLAAGLGGSLWTLFLHFEASGKGLDWEADKSYLLRGGPYSFSRNPMYLFELVLMFGWAVFYGSAAVFIAFLGWWAWFALAQVPQEERTIEARFGGSYLEYKKRIPRWLGKVRR
ncbi:MAG: methyltransferase family protein [Bacteroidota bacterium]